MAKPLFFKTAGAFRAWLERHHERATELSVGFHRKDSGEPSLTWPESVDEALCFGWIDDVRRSLDISSYFIRFTPRRPRSVWSRVNIAKAEEQIRLGRMTSAGLAAFERRDPARSGIYPFEQASATLDEPSDQRFRCNEAA